MEGTRLRILQLLQKNRSNTVDGLAKAIGLASATIRRHLDILQRDRLVEFEEVRKRTGRPEYSFSLTELGHEALPKDYDGLAEMLVQQLSSLTTEDTNSKTGQEILETIFERVAVDVSMNYDATLAGTNLSERLDTLIRHLEQKHFFPEAEFIDNTLRIKLLNCPFRSVALQNKSVCTFDLKLISSLLDTDVDRTGCIHEGDNGCTYTAAIGPGQSIPSSP